MQADPDPPVQDLYDALDDHLAGPAPLSAYVNRIIEQIYAKRALAELADRIQANRAALMADFVAFGMCASINGERVPIDRLMISGRELNEASADAARRELAGIPSRYYPLAHKPIEPRGEALGRSWTADRWGRP